LNNNFVYAKKIMEGHKIKITKNTTMSEQVQIPVEKSIPIILDRSWHVTGTPINKNGDVKLVFFMKHDTS
jgi:hypothetical protein